GGGLAVPKGQVAAGVDVQQAGFGKVDGVVGGGDGAGLITNPVEQGIGPAGEGGTGVGEVILQRRLDHLPGDEGGGARGFCIGANGGGVDQEGHDGAGDGGDGQADEQLDEGQCAAMRSGRNEAGAENGRRDNHAGLVRPALRGGSAAVSFIA